MPGAADAGARRLESAMDHNLAAALVHLTTPRLMRAVPVPVAAMADRWREAREHAVVAEAAAASQHLPALVPARPAARAAAAVSRILFCRMPPTPSPLSSRPIRKIQIP